MKTLFKICFFSLTFALLFACASCGACEHAFGEWETVVSPTCEKSGSEIRTCEKCGKTQTRALAASHTYGTVTARYKDTVRCTVSSRCAVCNYVEIVDKVHVPSGDWTVTKAPTCMADGKEVRYCANCGGVATTRAIPKLDILEVHEDYRIVFLADTHFCPEPDKMFDMTSAERTEMAVQCVIKENAKEPVDLVVFTGDNVNNYRYAYQAGAFESWKTFTYEGVTYKSQYNGVKYPAGESGTTNDPLGVLRILSFLELLRPLDDAGIRYIVANGNHDCYRDEIFEMAYKMNHVPGYIEGEKYYECDEDYNLLVKDYEICNGVFSFVDRVITQNDAEYALYDKGYGQNYTFAFDYDTAFAVIDAYHCEGVTDSKGRWVESGFVNNASGRSWPAIELESSVIRSIMNKVKDYKDVYCVLHCAGGETASKQQALYTAMKNNENVVCVFDGHTHMETVEKNVGGTGKYRFTCGYFGIPMYERQKLFQQEPFSYRVLEKDGGKLSTHIALVEHDYPAYTFTQSSGASVPAFYQPFTTRGFVTIREETE